jgi:hypothetical protein
LKKYVVGDVEYNALPKTSTKKTGFLYMVEVYVDEFMRLIIPISQEQLQHVATTVMMGIHDVFPPDKDDSNNSISVKR